MREIDNIGILRTKYTKKLLGDQVQIAKTPFHVEAGRLTNTGYIKSATDCCNYVENADFTLVATTNNQAVANVINERYRRLMLTLKATTSVTSYDYRLRFFVRGGVGAVAPGKMGDDGAPNTRWSDDALTNNQVNIFDGLIPYGENLQINLQMDNNHATDAIVIQSSWLFYDPVY